MSDLISKYLKITELLKNKETITDLKKNKLDKEAVEEALFYDKFLVSFLSLSLFIDMIFVIFYLGLELKTLVMPGIIALGWTDNIFPLLTYLIIQSILCYLILVIAAYKLYKRKGKEISLKKEFLKIDGSFILFSFLFITLKSLNFLIVLVFFVCVYWLLKSLIQYKKLKAQSKKGDLKEKRFLEKERMALISLMLEDNITLLFLSNIKKTDKNYKELKQLSEEIVNLKKEKLTNAEMLKLLSSVESKTQDIITT